MKILVPAISVLFVVLAGSAALADPARDAILATLAGEAAKADPAFAGFSAERGAAFWTASHAGGKADTPSCTSCHTSNPTAAGLTRAGKTIAPMAVSATPDRFTDPEKVATWVTRNCNTVLGRECTALEKGDVITYLSTK